MEMIDVLNKLKEISDKSPEVAKAVENVKATNPTEVKENAVESEVAIKEYAKTSYKDFLAKKGIDIYKIKGDEHVKYAKQYRDFKQGELAQDTPYSKSGTADNISIQDLKQDEGKMSDIHIGAQEKVGEYIDDVDGDLVKPKEQVIAELQAEMKAASFPQSYEIETAIQMVQDGFDDNGTRKDEPDPEDIPHDVDTQMNMDAPVEETPPVEEDMTPMGTRMFFDMGAKLDINFDMDQKGMMAGVLNRLDQDALMKSVDEYKAQELDPDQAESKELNTNTMKTEDKKPVNESKKPVKEAITMSADSPEEAGMLMQIMKLAGVQQVTPDMIGGEPGAEEPQADAEANPEHGEEGHDHSDCPVCGDDAVGSGDMAKMRDIVTSPDAEETDEAKADGTWDNTPVEKNQDIDYMQNKLAGGLNKPKQQVRKEYPGDNPLAVEDTVTEQDLANSLKNQYEGFKEQYSKVVKEIKNSK